MRTLATLLIVILFFACSTPKSVVQPGPAVAAGMPNPAMREFRAAWIATVANIDWPSKPGLSSDQQKKEALDLLDFLEKNNFNAVVLQVRPQCDALYKSDLEPWSYFLTGEQGKPPSPYYDPLEFWINESHKRGIELHVWLNPYRAHHKDGKEISDQSIVKKHPELVVKLKEGYYWLDPAQKGTRDHSNAVVMDIVNRYDIDGVHFDDYFYPYPSYNGGVDFPDSVSWTAYQQSGGKMSRGDWRRNAVNIFIEQLYKDIKKAKPYVKFGLSPFGIWRPGYPESIGGFDQYDQLYADAKLWLNKGWIDYFSPQLYWPINRMAQSFPVLLSWWQSENTLQRHLWPGISIGRDSSAKNVNEINSQIMVSRGVVAQSKGVIHWNISSLTDNPNMIKGIVNGPYSQKALVPASPWLDHTAPAAPVATFIKNNSAIDINWTHSQPSDVFHWVIYYQRGDVWKYDIRNNDPHAYNLHSTLIDTGSLRIRNIAVTAVDRTGNESTVKVVPVY
jgi:uncharacterized lipoprotein YddW (UPF0748 family)